MECHKPWSIAYINYDYGERVLEDMMLCGDIEEDVEAEQSEGAATFREIPIY